MKNRARRLAPLVRIARFKEREAARALGGLMRKLGDERQRVGDLHDYRQEYSRSVSQSGAGGTTARQLLEGRAFLGRLGQAIGQQGDLVDRFQAACESQRTAWHAARNRGRALDRALERIQQHEQVHDNRREQHRSDEHTQRLARKTLRNRR